MQTASPNAIETIGLTKRYGSRAALRNIELRVLKGEFATIFGPNGAGKTTLTKILASLARPTSGEAKILGISLQDAPPALRASIGIISHQSFLYGNLSARENLMFYGRLFGVLNLERRVNEVLEELDLVSRADSLVRTYSRGMTQRLAIARAVLHEPSVILLDEPYSGLDPHASDRLSGLLRRLNDGQRTLLMTTHNLEQGLELSHRVLIQVQGRLVFDAPASSLTTVELRQIYLEQLERTGERSEPRRIQP